jgi:hypothetical protein
MAKKPSSPPAAMVFPKAGAPYLVTQELPATTEAIEDHVVRPFAGELTKQGHEVQLLPRPETWPDAAILLDGHRVGLELVEVVDPRHRRMLQGQPWYIAELQDAFAELGVAEALAGMTLELFDEYQGLPPARSSEAISFVRSIATEMATEHREEFANSPINVLTAASFSAPHYRVTLFGVRASNSATTYNLRWNGAYMADPSCMQRTVQGKVAKRYTKKGGYDELWLLAWDSFHYLRHSTKQGARATLDTTPSHPFDALWTCRLPAPRVVVIEQIWPYDATKGDDDDPLVGEAIVFPPTSMSP